MEIQPVIELLTSAGLGPPALRALIPNVDNYSVLLMQPQGHIEASGVGVRHQNRKLADQQFRGFLDEARATNADLAVTPEYSMPWDTLVRAIKANHVPLEGRLWVFGCESIRYSELDVLKKELSSHAIMLYEQLQPDEQRFVDPLAYVFVAPIAQANNATRLVIVVQFKTCPMGDPGHFEVNRMQRGTCIYQFGVGPDNLRLVTLICSDAFEFLDQEALAVYDRALILHIQLNQKPRQYQYRQYRDRLFGYGGGATEILCLNWAKDVYEGCGSISKCWNNISGSAWYLCPDKFDDLDATLSLNHRRGLYYTWCIPMRAHALFFNYEPGIYLVRASKVAHIGVRASLSHRRGPQLSRMRTWDSHASAWADHSGPSDGFESVVGECGNAQDEIKRLASNNPFDAERVLALCAGNIGTDSDWHHLRKLDSCAIGAPEIIQRMTFCQDTDPISHTFRTARLKRCARLWDILHTDAHLPPALQDLNGGFRFEWAPQQNVISRTGRRATVVYMGEEASHADIEAVTKKMAEFLHRTFPTPNASIEARQRLHVWYRQDDGTIKRLDHSRYVTFDDPRSTSEFDIARSI
jgi:hypothetical protein